MSALLSEPPRSVAIVMLTALGDAVHVLPVANALRRAWPETRITWIIQPVPHRLVRGHAAIDEFLIFHRRRGLAGLRSFVDIRRQLRDRHYDLLLALQVYGKAGIITALADADIKLGFDRARARDLNWLVTNRRIPAHPVQHVQDQYFEFLAALGVDPEPVEWRVPITAEERAARHRFFAELDRPVCGVVVATSRPEKNWSAERYARLLDTITERHGVTPVIIGGPARLEREIADEVMRRTRAKPIDMLGDDLRRLVWLLDGCDLVISPDTGPLHIARALDTPVVGLYGFTNPRRAGPYRKYTELVVDGYARYPGEPYVASPAYRPGGMERVSVEAVVEKVGLALTKYARGRE